MANTMADKKPDSPAKSGADRAETPEAGGVTTEAQEVLSRVTEVARNQVASTLTDKKGLAAEGLGGVAEALRETTEALRQKEVPAVAPVIETAAERVEQLSDYLRSADIDELAEEVTRFASRRPAAFLAGAFALGFLGARLLLAGGQGPRAKAA
jgi:hypothetical protein